LYVRQSQFINNGEILRATFPCAFDGCTEMTNSPYRSGVMPYPEGLVMVRDSASAMSGRGTTVTFTNATDDLAMIKFVLGQGPAPGATAKPLADALMLNRRLPYWIGLLHDERPEVRVLAAGHLSKILATEVSGSPREGDADSGKLYSSPSALKAELEFARLMKWFETNKAQLQWDELAGRYVVNRSP
jgi:hypothetical protein